MKTSVDQLIEKMSLEDVCKYSNELAEAKLMEKEQIVKAAYEFMGTNFDSNMGRAEQYYNGTYKQQEP